MNAASFRHLYEYHFTENRTLWDTHIVPLPQEQFTRKSTYSVGSVRNQVVHLMSVDETWFCGLRGADIPRRLNPVHYHKRDVIRAYWDRVERMMRDYLAALRDDMLFGRPFPDGEDKDLLLWQVLLHVANHGTDHRAQMLRLLNDLGADTRSQDYIFFVYDHP